MQSAEAVAGKISEAYATRYARVRVVAQPGMRFHGVTGTPPADRFSGSDGILHITKINSVCTPLAIRASSLWGS
jgi:hypothetical protein